MSLGVNPTIFSGFDTCKLSGVHVSEKRLGHGSYASVFELEYKGQKCAGKKIHEILLEQGDASYTVRRFEEECRLLSMLSHPNIVQFLGVYFEEEKRVPMLVMEFLPTNLTSCIEQHGVLPLDTSIPILHDVALGLWYLHSRTPPIIHRDLSSNNVLLTNSMVAKISDLGVARMLNLSPLQISRMTETPGTPAYMPPEVMIANPRYDTSIDEFSYGIMMIHVFCGKWPEPQCGQIEMEEGTGRLIPITEAERRQRFLQDIGNDHSLMHLILKCVRNDPTQRPHAPEIESTVLHCLLNLPVDFNMVDDAVHLLDVLNKTRFLQDLLNKQDDRGYTLLHITAERNCLESLKCLVIKKANPNVQSSEISKNVTPLHIAAALGHLACLQLLVQQGGNILATDTGQLTPMDYARMNGKDHCLSYLNDVLAKKVREECIEMLKVLSVVEQNLIIGRTQLESMNHWKICDTLFPSTIAKLQLTVAENIKYRRCILYNDPELVRIFNGLTRHTECFPLLLHGAIYLRHAECKLARPECVPHLLHGANFLHAACRCGKLSLVQHLLDKMPAFAFSRTSEGYNALHIAVAHKQLDIVKALTQQQVTWVHNAHMASSSHEHQNQDNLEDSSSHEMAKFGSATMSGHTVIHLAVAVNDTSILNYLLKHSHDLRLSLDASECNYTALHLAVYFNHTDAVQLLLRRGANPNTRLDQSQLERVVISRTPLSGATTNKNLQMLSLLLEGGAEDKHYDAIRSCISSRHHHELMVPLLSSLVKHDGNYKPAKNAKDRRYKMAMMKWSGLQLTEVQPDWITGALHRARFLCSQNIDSSRVTEFVTCINLSKNHLKTLPQEVFFLPKLQQLIVSNNQLESLPEIQKVWIQSENDYAWPCFSLNRILLNKNHLVLLPDFIFHIPKLSFLDVSQNHLRKLPFSMWTAPKLHTFICNDNEIREIPTNWPHVMNECNIIHMSASLKSIESSTKSSLNSMEISGPPDYGSRGKKSFSLLSGSNEIEERTEAIKLTILQDRLDISNGLLPIEWQSSDSQDEESEGLALLELSNNHISEIPENLPCLCPTLICLKLKYNEIKTICFPQSFPSNLKQLSMSHNPLETLDCPQMMAKPLPCTNPVVLQESGFTIHNDKVSFCAHRAHLNLLNLSVLEMGHCCLKTVNLLRPQAVVQHGWNIESSNDQIENNVTVGSTVTTVGSNTWPQHRKHPSGLKLVFPYLTQLDLSYNCLDSVPDSICEMTELNTLDLSNNAITSLPVEMGKLHKLCVFSLYGLRLVYPPHSIINKGKTKDIIGFLWSSLHEAHPYHQMNLMLVGYAARGKTTLLQKITEKGKRIVQEYWGLRRIMERSRYSRSERPNISTVGIVVSDWTFYKQAKQCQSGLNSITFKTWDFGGQEEYYATYQCFLLRRSLYLVVWNVTRGMKGAQEIKGWLLDIQARVPHSPVIIVGTHEDKLNSTRLRQELEQAKDYINKTYGTLEKRKEGFPHVMYSTVVSCKSGYHIKELRDKIFDIASQVKETIITRHVGHIPEQCLLMDQPIPTFYLQLERTVQNIAMSMKLQGKPPILTYSELREAVLTDHQTQINYDNLDLALKPAISFLHDNGTMLHFEVPLLSNLHFLDPQWLCDMLAHIVTVRESNPLIRDGVMRISDFPLIFDDEEFPVQWQKEYIRLLTSFEVAVELGNGELLIPSALNPNKPNLSQTVFPENLNFLPPLRHCYVVPFIPSGFWPRLISRLLTDSTIIWLAREGCGLTEDDTDQLTWVKWRTGMILQYGNLTILSVKELNGGIFPKAQSCDGTKIYGEDKWRVHHSDFTIFGINIEVPDIYPILKYPETRFKTKIGNERLSKLITADSCLVQNSSIQRNQQLSADASSMLSSFIDEEKNDIMRAGLLSKVFDHISLLVENWFVGVRPRTSVIPCPFCSEDISCDVAQFRRSFSNNPMLLSSEERVERGIPADSEQQQTTQASPQEDPPSTEAPSTAVFGMDQNLSIIKTIKSNQYPRQDHLSDMKSERTHARIQTSARTSQQYSRKYCYTFKHHECIVTARYQDTMQCPTHGDIPLAYMAPDTLFMAEGYHILVKPEKLERGDFIGRGAFASIYKAKMKKMSEEGEKEIDVAFKALTKEWRLQEANPDYSLKDPIDADTQSVFSRNAGITRRSIIDGFGSVKIELSILSSLKHPHIIQLHGVTMIPLGLILELAPLGSLKHILHDYAEAHTHLHISVTKQVMIQVAGALQYIHENKIIYRDMKSDNVLAMKFPSPHQDPQFYGNDSVFVKLCDFGLSQFAPEGFVKGLVGMPGFMAPEILKYLGKERYNNKVDIFSYGMFLYELITLTVPLPHLNAQQVNQAHERGERPQLHKADFPCPILLRELMVWCWQQNPDDRPTTNDILKKMNSTSIEFSKLIDGIRLCDMGQVTCAPVITNHDQKASKISEKPAFNEIWVVSGDVYHSVASIIHYMGQFISIEDKEVGDSPVLCMCAICNKVWMGCENGQLIVFDTSTKRLLLQTWTKENIKVLSMVHITSLRQVYLGLGNGSVLMYSDELPLGLTSETPANVKFYPLMEYLDVKQISSSLLAVERIKIVKTEPSKHLHVLTDSQLSNQSTVQQPMRITTHELWVGQRSGFVTVLNAQTLAVITYIYNPFEISRVPSYVAFLVTNHPSSETYENCDIVSAPHKDLLTVYGAVYDGQFVTRWDVEKKSAVESYNCEKHLEEGAECNITALHYSQLQLYVGLKSGKILIMNAQKFNLIHCLDFHRGTVSSILSLNQVNLAKKDSSPEPETADSEVVPFYSKESDSHINQLLTIGVGFKSYFDGVEAQAKLNSSFMLVWQADDWTHA